MKNDLISYSKALAISNIISDEENKKFRELKNRDMPENIVEKLCVVIPNFNNNGIIQRVIESIEQEIGINVSIYILDNHSTDGSWEYIEELNKTRASISAIRMPFNSGPHYSSQLILKGNFHEYTLFASGNDLLAKINTINRMIAYLDMHKDVNLVYARNLRGNSYSEPRQFSFSVPGKSRRSELGLTDIDCFNQCTWLYTSSEPLWGIYRSSYSKLIPSLNGYGVDHLMISSVGFYGGITGINDGLKIVGEEKRSLQTLLASQIQCKYIDTQENQHNNRAQPLDSSNFLSLMYTYFNGIQLQLINDEQKDKLIEESCLILINRFFTHVMAELIRLKRDRINLLRNQALNSNYTSSFGREYGRQKLFIIKIIIPIIRNIILIN